MRKFEILQLVALLVTISAVTVAGAAVDNAYDALGLALPGDRHGTRIWVNHTEMAAGEPIETVKGIVGEAPASGWLIFSDDHAFANWEHPARFLFVETLSGKVSTVHVSVPPPDGTLELWEEVTPETRDLVLYDKTPLRSLSSAIPASNPNPRGGRNFAVLISGGASKSNNHIRYWNDLSNIYIGLVDFYGYPDENIIVLCSDGLDPAADRSDGSNSDPDLDGDGDDDIMYPATQQYIDQVFDELTGVLRQDDMLFVFTTDHGGSNGGWNVFLNLWNWEEMSDSHFENLVDALPECCMVFTMEQCYSGGFEDNLVGTRQNRIFSSACAYNELSWAMPPDYKYDTYVFHWTAAVRWEDAYGTPVDADTNDDGIVDMNEAFIYAEDHDISAETPQYGEYPAGIGDQTSLFGTMSLGYLEGYVRASGSGLPIESAELEITGTSYGTVTNQDGYYWMFAPAGEPLEILASCFGYEDGSQQVTVPEGETLTLDFDLDPAPNGGIEGYVLDLSGDPIAGAEVTILDTPLDPCESGIDGFYSFPAVPAGAEYELRASEIGHVPETGTAAVFEGQVTRLDFYLQEGFSSDMETGEQGWTHYKIKATHQDEWHLENYRNHTPGGTWSWKLGGDGAGEYGGWVDGALESPSLDLGFNPVMTFYHWIECATVNQWSAYDGGIVEIKTPGGEWTQIEPEGGYPYTIFFNLFNPFPAGTPCFAGDHGWQQETFDLSDYSGLSGVKIRFHFGSGNMNDGEGWYVDDILIQSGKAAGIAVEPGSATVPKGGLLQVDVTVTNLVDDTVTARIYSELYLPGGIPYPGNPLDGPLTIEMTPGWSGSGQVSHTVPLFAPTGVYSYFWKVEVPPGSLADQDIMTFEVVDSD